MQGQAARFAADIKRLLERKEEFVYVPCPACGSEQSNKLFEKYELSYARCCECATMYVTPRPTPAILEMYYSTSENYAYWNKHIFPASEDTRREKIFRPRAERVAEICKQYGVRTDVLMEVGAGFGTFCEEMQRLNLFRKVIAIEPTPDLAETCRRKGLEVTQKPIEQVSIEGDAINVITSFEVIEHLFSPQDFLRNCAAVLESGGLLIITCPNVKGFDMVVLQDRSDTVDVEHLNYFHPASLSILLQTSGFEVLEALTPGKLDAELVRKKVLAGDVDISTQPFLQQVLLEGWDSLSVPFQQFLANNRLSSHMWLVARKRED